jgi:hypothetical protein
MYFQFFFKKHGFQKNGYEKLWSPHYLLKWELVILNFSFVLFIHARRACALKMGLFSPYLTFLWRLEDELFFLSEVKNTAF